MPIKFTKLIFIIGFLFLKIAYAAEIFEMEDIPQHKNYLQEKANNLVSIFYDYYDSYKEELNNQGINFGQKNFLEIIEDNFQYFTGVSMDYYVGDYFFSNINFFLNSSLEKKMSLNIYEPIFLAVRFFASHVIGSPEYDSRSSLSDNTSEAYGSSDDETLSESEEKIDWFLFFEKLDPIAWNLMNKSQKRSTHVIYLYA
jgi:hypothetical protein